MNVTFSLAIKYTELVKPSTYVVLYFGTNIGIY